MANESPSTGTHEILGRGALPIDCPIPASDTFVGARLTGRHAQYTNADTWYPSWAPDGDLYSPWTDGYLLDGAEGAEQVPFDPSHPSSACNSVDFLGRKASTAQARIVGDDPLNLKVFNIPPHVQASPAPEYEKSLSEWVPGFEWRPGPDEYEGRYPCGSLVLDGTWYYGTYCLSNRDDTDSGGVGWTQLGPFVGFRTSEDLGRTWTETPCTPSSPLFGENPRHAPVRIGAPHFVDFGRNMEHSPDGYAYLTAQGSTDPQAWNSWIQSDQVYLLRVKPSIETINDASAYEFFAGYDPDGSATWTNDLAEMRPLLEWADNLGCVTATYNPGLGKYLMCVSRVLQPGHANFLLLEADEITGPWRVVVHATDFGPAAYFINIPSKFISEDGKTLWLCYSANWDNWTTEGGDPEGSHYAMCLHEVTLSPAD